MNHSTISLFPSSDDTNRFPTQPLTAVAVGKDKNSQHAMKWAVDHLLMNSKTIILIHVRTRWDRVHYGYETSPELGKEQVEAEEKQMFVSYRRFCALKGLQMKEVVLEDSDVSKAIADYIIANSIHNIAVGASSRNALTRKFKPPSISSCLIKTVPEFCGVYVIYKDKRVTIRSMKISLPVTACPPTQSIALGSLQAEQFDCTMRNSGRTPDCIRIPLKDKPLSIVRTTSNDAYDMFDSSFGQLRTGFHNSVSSDIDLQRSMDFQFMDFDDAFEFGNAESPHSFHSPPVNKLRDVEAKMRRLRLELKQTTEMYNAACKEAVMAKEKARVLHELNIKEARRIEELKKAEEAAGALIEVEKEKCKANLEAAEASQRLAELEAKRRQKAELKAKCEVKERKKAMETMSLFELRYRRYSIDVIEAATDFFSEELKIGEDAYGPVFRAQLDHTPVAIKMLRPDLSQGRNQFQQEVEVLSCIRHPNMVLLLGACPEYGCLVYEHMDYGSLEDRLFRRGNTPPIPWTRRFKIAAEIATALLFLHRTKPEPLVHRDLKPANILLDHHYASKISDVGLSRLLPPSVSESVTQYRMTSAAGTFCYIDPENQKTAMLGTKSDIYSFGVMMLQIITAKPPMGLRHHVERAIEKGTFAEMLDPTIKDWPVEEALAYVKLALKCAELRRKDRPDLGKVILPELNRLRSIGQAYEATHSNNNSNLGDASRTSGSGEQRRVSSMHQEQISHPISSAPWTCSTAD